MALPRHRFRALPEVFVQLRLRPHPAGFLAGIAPGMLEDDIAVRRLADDAAFQVDEVVQDLRLAVAGEAGGIDALVLQETVVVVSGIDRFLRLRKAQVLPEGLSAFEVFADLHPDALAGCDVLQEHVRIMVVCEGIADAEDPDFIGGFRRLGQLEPLGLGGRGKDDGQDQAEDAFHGRVCYCFPAQAGQVPLTT